MRISLFRFYRSDSTSKNSDFFIMPGVMHLYLLAATSKSINFIRHCVPGGSTIWTYLDAFLLLLVDVYRLFAGRWQATGLESCTKPQKPLLLYEFEGCPYCRKVRETLSVLSLDHIVYPCPRETLKSAGNCLNSRYRPEVLKLGGTLKFPFLVDPNTDRKMFESDEIINYLWKNYGATAKPPLNYLIAHWPPYRDISMKLCSLLRPCVDMGILRAPSYNPDKNLELWGYESSAFVRRVREVLTVLELPYLYHEIPFGASEKRNCFKKLYSAKFSQKALREKLGIIQVPFLKDPNTSMELFESADIVRYLRHKYQTATVPVESWRDYGANDAKKAR